MRGIDLKKWLPLYVCAAAVCIMLAVFGSNAVTTAVQNGPVERHYTVIIDAGHGGIDGGATSCTGVLESAINLEIALKLNDLLQLLGYDTVMIRTTDTSVYTEGSTIAAQKVSDLKERVRICNETDNALLLSIHQNTFSNSRYSGPQVFYAGTGESSLLADRLQTALSKQFAPGSKRTAKAAKTVYLLQNIRCDGVLIECGFLSNPEEEAKLRDGSYQQKLCIVIAIALGDFLHQKS